MKKSRTAYIREVLVLACALHALAELQAQAPSSPADAGLATADGALVTRRGATVHGVVDGTLVAVDENASVAVERGGELRGDVILRTEKTLRRIDFRKPVEKAKVSPRAKVQNRGGRDAIKGETRVIEGFDLPRVIAREKPIKSQNVVVQGETLVPADFSEVENFSLRKSGITVALPSGAYGAIKVTEGRIVLGTASSTEPTRYDMKALEVGAAGRIDVVGPVVVTIADGGIWKGHLGNMEAPLWLDLRVAGGDVLLNGSGKFAGLITAPSSTVTLADEASLQGGVISDQLNIAAKATAVVFVPDWSGNANEVTRPRFPHKALRLEAKVPALREGFRHTFYPGIAYVDDVPFVMMSEGRRPRQHPLAAFEESRAFFEACCSLFLDTGFERGGVTMAAHGENDSARATALRNVMLTREQFETEVTRLGEKEAIADNIDAIALHPQRLAEFNQRILADAAAGAGRR